MSLDVIIEQIKEKTLNNYQIIILFFIAVAWLGGGNYIIIRSFRRRNIPLWNLFNPLAIFNLENKDYLKIFLLAVSVLAIGGFAISLAK